MHNKWLHLSAQSFFDVSQKAFAIHLKIMNYALLIMPYFVPLHP